MSTPIRLQYLELKQRYPDTILFFRLGDFYETFDDDARLIAAELQITLTSKPMGKDLRVPLAGVPYHSIDGHVAKLVARGHRVAICEQMADPADVKGIVPRDVVRVVTAGTVTSEASLESGAANYLAAYAVRSSVPAVALSDITTGEIRLVQGSEAPLELLRSGPSELLVEPDEELPPGFKAVVTVRLPLSEFAVRAELGRQFGDHAISTLVDGAAEAAALAHLIAYLRETYAPALGTLQRVRHVALAGILTVDERTRRNLDVLPQQGHSSSLVGVLNRSRSAMGSRLLRGWLSHPDRKSTRLNSSHESVSRMPSSA